MNDCLKNTIETDVLVVGGGASGCFAAIGASRLGAKVTLIEKAALRRCSCTGPGMDHIALPPELGGKTAQRPSFLNTVENPYARWLMSRDGYNRILDLEKFNVRMRQEDGTIKVSQKGTGMAFWGPDLQIKLAEAVRNHNVNVVERVMAVDLLTQGNKVTGLVGLNTRTGEIVTAVSKGIILTTGNAARAYTGYNGELFDTRKCASNDGGAVAMAYRAGAEVTGLEFIVVRTDLKNEKLLSLGMFTRFPAGPAGRVVNAKGEVIEKELSDFESVPEYRAWRENELPKLILKEEREGRGPCYWDLTHIPDSQVEAIYWQMRAEFAIREQFQKDRGVWGMKKSKFLFEIRVTPTSILGGVLTDEYMRTSMKGLYAAGDAVNYWSLSAATVTGYVAGESAAKDSSKITEYLKIDETQLAQIVENTCAPTKVKDGLNPIDFERKVRMILDDYAGLYKSEGKLKQGLKTLEEIKEKFMATISAKNPHELMRAVEARNIWLIAKMHLEASLFRNETRPYVSSDLSHNRVDYPETKVELNKPIIIKKADREMSLSWRDSYVKSQPT